MLSSTCFVFFLKHSRCDGGRVLNQLDKFAVRRIVKLIVEATMGMVRQGTAGIHKAKDLIDDSNLLAGNAVDGDLAARRNVLAHQGHR